jgi:phosphopantetheinyl transferase (holo-ACP synthase)
LKTADKAPSCVSAVDLITVERVRRLLAENPAMLDSLCSPVERTEWRGERGMAELLALKEAALKALGGPGADEANWLEIEVRRWPVRLRFAGALSSAAERAGKWHGASGSTARLAVAWVVGERA